LRLDGGWLRLWRASVTLWRHWRSRVLLILLRTRLTILSGHIAHGDRPGRRPQRRGGLSRRLWLRFKKILGGGHIAHGDGAGGRTKGCGGLLNSLRRGLLPAPDPLHSWRIKLGGFGERKILTLSPRLWLLLLCAQILVEDWLGSALDKYRDVADTGAHCGRRLRAS